MSKCLICDYCKKEFEVSNDRWKKARYKKKKKGDKIYCSYECRIRGKGCEIPIEKPCSYCGEITKRRIAEIKRNKSERIFCNSSCAATYNNTHKTKGTRRSKLEFWLEARLPKLFPTLEILYSYKEAINSELDIYIPSLNLAFELNGIFHYEPIFGGDKLSQIQNNDSRKFQACLERGIELCIIDTSGQKYFKDSTSQKYLDIITSIINGKIGAMGIEPII